jgi:hypothetical protein
MRGRGSDVGTGRGPMTDCERADCCRQGNCSDQDRNQSDASAHPARLNRQTTTWPQVSIEGRGRLGAKAVAGNLPGLGVATRRAAIPVSGRERGAGTAARAAGPGRTRGISQRGGGGRERGTGAGGTSPGSKIEDPLPAVTGCSHGTKWRPTGPVRGSSARRLHRRRRSPGERERRRHRGAC